MQRRTARFRAYAESIGAPLDWMSDEVLEWHLERIHREELLEETGRTFRRLGIALTGASRQFERSVEAFARAMAQIARRDPSTRC